MAEKDLRKGQMVEISLIEGDEHRQEFQVIERSEVDLLPAGGVQQPVNLNEPSGHQRLKPAPGIITRIGRGVKSAVGGAVNMILQSGKCRAITLLVIISCNEFAI